MVIVGHNPMFYDKTHFCSYLFPANYLRDFSLLGIDPGKIEAVLHPSLNLINISKFFKWLNNTGRKIKIFSNSTDIELLKKLYAGAVIRKENFSGLNYRADSGLTIRNYPDTFNLKVIFNNVSPAGESMTVAYLKTPGGAREIIRDKPDLIVASYTAYEDIAMLLKSTAAPCAVIDDGNRNIRKLAGGDRIVLSPGIHYALYRFGRAEDMAACAGLGEDLTARITGDTDALLAELAAPADGDAADESRRKLIFNILSMVRVYQHETRDRKLSARLRDFTAALTARYGRPGDFIDPARHIIALALYNGGLFQFMTDYRGAARAGTLRHDRKRRRSAGLPASTRPCVNAAIGSCATASASRRLIEIYTRSAQYHEKNMPGMDELKRAIETRKDQYREESLSLDHSWSRSIAGETPVEETPAEAGPAGFLARAAERIRALPLAVKLAVPIAALLIIIAAVLLSYNAPVIVRAFRSDRGTAVAEPRYRHPLPQTGEGDEHQNQGP